VSISDLTGILGIGVTIVMGGFWVLNLRIASLLDMITKLQEKEESHAIEIERLKSGKGNDD